MVVTIQERGCVTQGGGEGAKAVAAVELGVGGGAYLARPKRMDKTEALRSLFLFARPSPVQRDAATAKGAKRKS